MELESARSIRHSKQNPSEFEGLGQACKPSRAKSTGITVGVLAVVLFAGLAISGVATAQKTANSDAESTKAQAYRPASGRNLLVLIDPGHGGTNGGAASIRANVFEKHLTLAMATLLKDRLSQNGFDVRLTRTKDTYLTLRQRGHIANEMNADVFISLHANATESHSQSGYETFILTPDAIDIDTRALRQESGRVRDGVTPKTAALLDDIERSTTQLLAAKLAASVQTNMSSLRGKAGDRGVRQDSMHVLLGATMPAILVEVGFIDHPVEGEELMDLSLRAQMIDGIARAIEKHADALRSR